MRVRLVLSLLLTLATVGALAPGAHAIRVDALPGVDRNPVERLARLAPDPEEYDRATHCSRAPRPGVTAFVGWLERNSAGAFWGSYRCETWGEGEASLHAEGRAVDWHLDSRDPRERAAGKRLVALLLATDSAGTSRALARRMGVQEIIWDCSYWGAGNDDFGPYGPCFDDHGRRRKRVDPTVGHLDHLHIGLSKAGAAKRTSWWRRAA